MLKQNQLKNEKYWTFLKTVYGLMPEWKVLQVLIKIQGKHRVTPKGTWVLASGTQNRFLVHKGSVREKNEQLEILVR